MTSGAAAFLGLMTAVVIGLGARYGFPMVIGLLVGGLLMEGLRAIQAADRRRRRARERAAYAREMYRMYRVDPDTGYEISGWGIDHDRSHGVAESDQEEARQ